jgi:hypothetical protein
VQVEEPITNTTILTDSSRNKNYSEWRFGKYAAIGTCHLTDKPNY